jgi:hypothetical protein
VAEPGAAEKVARRVGPGSDRRVPGSRTHGTKNQPEAPTGESGSSHARRPSRRPKVARAARGRAPPHATAGRRAGAEAKPNATEGRCFDEPAPEPLQTPNLPPPLTAHRPHGHLIAPSDNSTSPRTSPSHRPLDMQQVPNWRMDSSILKFQRLARLKPGTTTTTSVDSSRPDLDPSPTVDLAGS